MPQINPDDYTDEQRTFIGMLQQDAINRYLDGDLGALDHSVAMKPHDAAHWMLLDDKTSTPVVHKEGCYICEDPEFAAMGLPLCMKCTRCGGHVAADDDTCEIYQDGTREDGTPRMRGCGHCMNPYTQLDSDGLAPGGFPESILDPDGSWEPPYGDFETSEPFRVQTGVLYDGSPQYFGDYQEPEPPHEFELHDLVRVRCGDTYWQGEIHGIFGGQDGQFLITVTAPFTAGGIYADGQEMLCTRDQLEYAGHVYGPRT